MYEKTVKLHDDEIPAKINARTGEIKEVLSRPNNLPKEKIVFEGGYYKKMFDKTWDFLLDKLNPVELKIVVKMCQMSRMNSNSLNPLNNESSMREIAATFNVDRKRLGGMLKKLMKLGVYAEFKFGDRAGNIRHYWVLSPYVSFKGKTIDIGIVDLFRETRIADLYLDDV